MSLSDELHQLGELHQRGVLSDEEFARAKAKVLNGTASPATTSATATAINTLRRSRDDRWIGGVCGGIARLTGVESWLWRILMVLLVLCGGTGVLLYAPLGVFVPDAGLCPDRADHLERRRRGARGRRPGRRGAHANSCECGQSGGRGARGHAARARRPRR